MNIMLGNLTVEQIEKRIGIDFPDDIRTFMNENHQAKAEKTEKGKWHCFDMPFTMVCGDRETAMKIYDSVKERAKEIKEPLQFYIQG